MQISSLELQEILMQTSTTITALAMMTITRIQRSQRLIVRWTRDRFLLLNHPPTTITWRREKLRPNSGFSLSPSLLCVLFSQLGHWPRPSASRVKEVANSSVVNMRRYIYWFTSKFLCIWNWYLKVFPIHVKNILSAPFINLPSSIIIPPPQNGTLL